MAHLYTAARAIGALDKAWPEVDFVIDKHSRGGDATRSWLLQYSSNVDVALMAKQYNLALGVKHHNCKDPKATIPWYKYDWGDRTAGTLVSPAR